MKKNNKNAKQIRIIRSNIHLQNKSSNKQNNKYTK